MNPVLRSLVERGGGLATRAVAAQVLPVGVVEAACRAGQLRRVLPAVYADAALVGGEPGSGDIALADLPAELRQRAVAVYADGRGAFSHLSALEVWGLRRQPAGEVLHLSVPAGIGLRTTREELLVHHRRNFVLAPPQVVIRRGLPVTRLESALVDAWPLLPAAERRAPLIDAVNGRLTTPERIGDALAAAPRLTGRAELRHLVQLLAIGCRSPLEIWGHEQVFVGPGMPAFQRQVPVRLGQRTVYLDLYAKRERVNIELDGATTHGDPRQREVDLRRDSQLAALGILVVRFSHRRLLY
ncbi:MAG TPA: DUF559 domain-containing protein, partial [Micromonosporaceae bacterium]|nr:DUF559 domain-containing protein [Micromonosporaceae bacterium]